MEDYRWELFLALIAIAGFVTSIFKASKYFSSMENATVNLKETIELLREELQSIAAHNRDSHKRLWEHNEEQDDILNDHETRIKIIEKKGGTK